MVYSHVYLTNPFPEQEAFSLRVGVVGTGAIAWKHAQAYKNIGFDVVVCTNQTHEKGLKFAEATGAEFVESVEDVCRHPAVEMVDVCTFPSLRLQPVQLCAKYGKHIQVQKPIATDVATARSMIDCASRAGMCLGVVSQHRFDDSSLFLKAAIRAGRLGKLLQADAYVKWFRSPDYYSRAVKGSWATEGGGAMINQAIHQVDLLLWFVGSVQDVYAAWQLGSRHRIESEDVIAALVRYGSGATGVIQASTAFWPGYPERIEIHGTRGTAVITGDKLTAWDVPDDEGDPPPLAQAVASGASNPMAISTLPFERQFVDFEDAIRTGRTPLVSGEEGLQALQVVTACYESARLGERVSLPLASA